MEKVEQSKVKWEGQAHSRCVCGCLMQHNVPYHAPVGVVDDRECPRCGAVVVWPGKNPWQGDSEMVGKENGEVC